MTYDDLMRILSRKKMSPMEFCRQTGITPQTITNAKSRGGHFSAITMEKMKDLVSDDIEITLSEQEKDLITEFRTASEDTRRKVIEMLAFFKSQESK